MGPIDNGESWYWSESVTTLCRRLSTGPSGLAEKEAAARLTQWGPNRIGDASHTIAIGSFARQFRNPLVLVLIFAASVSVFVGNRNEAAIIGLIVQASCLLSFSQKYAASKATEDLRRQISARVTCVRSGVEVTMPAEDIANTMKYTSITTSANFGNMISMAFASLFLPFLPLLAKQILLNNLLSSVPSLAIASDNVDPEEIETPRRWDIGSVRRLKGILESH